VPVLPDTFAPPPEGAACWVQPRRHPAPEGFDNASERFSCHQITAWVRPDQLPVFRAHYARAEATGLLRSYFHAPARALVRDGGQGRVRAVLAERDWEGGGGFLRATARKGVVLATGDYMGDRRMVLRFLPGYASTPTWWTSYDRHKAPSNTGDGHKMGAWVGAKIQDAPHAALAHHMGGVFGVNAFLLLNTRGQRFVNEDAPGQQIGSQIENLPDKLCWQIVDGAWAGTLAGAYASHGTVNYLIEDAEIEARGLFKKLSPIDNVVNQGIVDAAVEKGRLARAETLAGLFEAIGLPVEGSLASVERYNALCRAGLDEDFGKQPKRLHPVATPPFYACKFDQAGMLACLGGLQSDPDARCYGVDGKPIPGLYVAGNVQGNRVAVDYPMTVPGLSHSLALTFGRVAGQSAAAGA
jgi:hypothetical protein